MTTLEMTAADLLADEILRLFQEKFTGTLFITGENNQMGLVGFENGRIIALSCLNRHGAEAVSLIRQFAVKKLQFLPVTVRRDPGLPPTTELLKVLVGPSADAGPEQAPAPGSRHGVSEPIRIRVQEMLTEFVGPVAGLLCNEVFKQTHDLASAIDVLARQIPNAQEQTRFKQWAVEQGMSGADSAATGPAPVAALRENFEQTQRRLQDRLAELMGPVAALICSKAFKQTNDPGSAVDLLAKQIPDLRARMQFQEWARQQAL